jgi:hypothetical protein
VDLVQHAAPSAPGRQLHKKIKGADSTGPLIRK